MCVCVYVKGGDNKVKERLRSQKRGKSAQAEENP